MKPILFNTEMVQAILDGRKTQTRRVMKDAQSDWRFLELQQNPDEIGVDRYGEEYPKETNGLYAIFEAEYGEFPMSKSKYQPGDILWVRETWSPVQVLPKRYLYKADAENGGEGDGLPIRWRPSIHMPREAARLFLRVTDVRVERVQEITLSDIEREGLYCDPPYTRDHFAYAPGMRKHWRMLWDSINAKRGYSWDTNPWVWVYEFEQVGEPDETV